MTAKLIRLVGVIVVSLAACGVGNAQTQGEFQDAALIEAINEPWTGDFDGLIERGVVRLLTVHNPLFVSYDGIEQAGLIVELAREFENWLNEKYGSKGHKIVVVSIPVPRDELLPRLVDGRGDLAVANLTITPERERIVAFSIPMYTNVSELVVTGPAAQAIETLDDLATTEVHVRRSSSYFEHLTSLNQQRRDAGKPVIPLLDADEHLEDYDLLEMVNAGLVPAVIVDSHKAALWGQVLDNIEVRDDLAIHTGGSIAWAFRKDNPEFLKVANEFLVGIRKGSLVGNVLLKRYLVSTRWIDNSLSAEGRARYRDTVEIIKQYAGEYDFDWLMIAAQGYQESKLDQTKRSAAGAIGIMQVLPSTAADKNVGIDGIEDAENNVHAGVRYLRFLRDRYFKSSDISHLDQVLFAFAAYNAGPAKISKIRKKAAEMGFDPNRWFGHVEVAAAKHISREPVIYVRNIFKYFIAYKHLEEITRLRSEDAPQ